MNITGMLYGSRLLRSYDRGRGGDRRSP